MHKGCSKIAGNGGGMGSLPTESHRNKIEIHNLIIINSERNMKKQFNEYMELEAPIQLKVLFHEMDESQAIMLQECFHAFARKVVSDVQSENGKLPIPHVSKRICPKAGQCANTPGGMICPKDVICPI